MDPATGAITLVGATISVAKCIEKVRLAKAYPTILSAVLAEVADLQLPLANCDAFLKANQHLGTTFQSSGLKHYLEKAKCQLEELHCTLDSYIGSNELAPHRKIESFATALIRGKARVAKCRDEFRKTREGLLMSLQVLAAPAILAIDSQVNGLAEGQNILLYDQRELLEYVKSLCHSLTSADDMTRGKPTRLREPLPGMKAIKDVPLPPDQLGKFCVPWCSCCCHAGSSVYLPLGGLKDVFGALTVTYSGLPGLTKSCDEKGCRRRISSKVRVSYDFPRLLIQRRLVLSYSCSDLAGPEIRVRLPRVVEWTSPIWVHATSKNTMALQSQFQRGRASPWDVNRFGGNLLHYATDHWNPELCQLLLECGVDPSAEDDFKQTAVGIAWERVLSGKMTSDEASMVASLFKDADYLSTLSLTLAHKIVLGVASMDLDGYLSSTTQDIDRQDSRGRTPVSWAVARGDYDTTATLLKHGADPNIADICGNYPIHYVQDTACAQLLFDHDANMEVLNHDGQSALYTACRYVGSASLTAYLIQASPHAVSQADYKQETPLHVAAIVGKDRPFIRILLDAGADVNAKNSSFDSPLRFLVFYNMHDTLLRILEKSGTADFGGINSYGQTFAHAIARTADVETVRLLAEAKPASLEADFELHDLAGKTSLEYFEDRLAPLDVGEQEELREAFQKLIQALSKTDLEEAGHEAAFDVPIAGKLQAVVRISECFDGVTASREVFHDALEGF